MITFNVRQQQQQQQKCSVCISANLFFVNFSAERTNLLWAVKIPDFTHPPSWEWNPRRWRSLQPQRVYPENKVFLKWNVDSCWQLGALLQFWWRALVDVGVYETCHVDLSFSRMKTGHKGFYNLGVYSSNCVLMWPFILNVNKGNKADDSWGWMRDVGLCRTAGR